MTLTDLADAVERDDGTGIYDLLREAAKTLSPGFSLDTAIEASDCIRDAELCQQPTLLLGVIALLVPEGCMSGYLSYPGVRHNGYCNPPDVVKERSLPHVRASSPSHALLAAVLRAHAARETKDG